MKMNVAEEVIPSIYDYPDYYPVTSPGCEGDVDFYIEEVKASGPPFLELGCGTGRTLIPLAQAGLEGTGIDNAPPMLKVCEEAVIERELKNVKIMNMDMRMLNFHENFKTVIIPYRAFLCLYTVKDQLDTLVGVHKSLVSGGKLIFNMFDPDVQSLSEFCKLGSSYRIFRSGIVPRTGAKLVTWATTTCDPLNQVIDEIWRYEELTEEGRIKSTCYGRFKVRYVFRYEMEHLLNRVGFAIEKLYGSFDRSQYRNGAEQVWICRKLV